VLYLHDAQNLFDEATAYAGEWGVDETMDALQRDTGFGAIVVGIDHGGERRLHELAAWPHPQFGHADAENYFADLVHEIKPFVDANYRTRPGREWTAIGGSSFGGIASHFGLLRYPDVFFGAIVFSPSYWVSEQAFMQARNAPLYDDSRVYLYMGGAEGAESVEQVTRMRDVFAQRLPEDQVRLYVAEDAGHDEAAWRAEFPHAVRWLFGLSATR
jgi:predicted alpha/beta superfamily hydrolase